MLQDVIKKIKKASKIAIFNHENPDGDAMGSAYGLKLILQSLSKEAEVFLREGDERLKEFRLIKGTESSSLSVDDCDLKIAVDCADIRRLGSMQEKFSGNTAAIDHHITHVEFAEATFVDGNAPAAGELIFELAEELGAEISEEIATNLYVAITCDTGSFKYSSTTPKTHRTVAKLLEKGVDVGRISKEIFDTKSFEYLNAYKKGIDKLEMFSDGRIAMLTITEAEFAEMGVDEVMIDGIVNLPRTVEGVEVGIYIRQRGEEFKVSLRSNGEVDVSKIAEAFDGGGHKKASGFVVKNPLDKAKKDIISEIEKQLVKN